MVISDISVGVEYPSEAVTDINIGRVQLIFPHTLVESERTRCEVYRTKWYPDRGGPERPDLAITDNGAN
jgi:hypothetical protein